MSFQDAIRTCLTQKYADFQGRARRSEFWWFWLFWVIVRSIAQSIDRGINNGSPYTGGVLTGLVSLALLLPILGVAVRRLHDTGRSGWWVLIGIIPIIGWIVLLVFFVQDSHADNQYGPSPKGFEGAYPPPPAAPQY